MSAPTAGETTTATDKGRRAPASARLVLLVVVLALGLTAVALATGSGRGVTTRDETVASTSPSDAPSPAETVAANPCPVDPADGEDAIIAAIRGCPDGSTVVFPKGRTYHQNDKILVLGRADLVIDGNGSTFVTSAPSDTAATIYQARPNWMIVESTNVVVRNMTIRGNLTPGPRGILPGNQYNAGIIIYGGKDITVTDISVFSVFGEFVVSNPSGFYHGKGAVDGEVPVNVRVRRLRGEHAGRQCVGVTAAEGFWLEDSTLQDCYQNGVDVEHDWPGEKVHDVHIVGNSIGGYYIAAITVPTAYQTGDVDGVEIRGNKTITASDSCHPSVLIGGVQNNTNMLKNIVVADNTLMTLNAGIKYTHVASGRITGNNITLTASPPNLCGPPPPQPVQLVDAANVVAESNPAKGY